MKYHVLYNPLAGNGKCEDKLGTLKDLYKNENAEYYNMTEISDLKAFAQSIPADDCMIICGGDGTLNRFANQIGDAGIACDMLYYPAGSGNDFLHDIGCDGSEPFPIKKYLESLPYVTVNGNTYRFLNGIGYGIDGYCCEEGDKVRAKAPGKTVNYTAIAIKGLLFFYHPTTATVTVDGASYEFKNVWLAPTMNGRYYGGGMEIAPAQDRLNADRKLTLVVLHCKSKLKTLTVFPTIFKGEHVVHTDMVSTYEGYDITVKFDKPVALQIDGETVLGVSEYRAYSSTAANK